MTISVLYCALLAACTVKVLSLISWEKLKRELTLRPELLPRLVVSGVLIASGILLVAMVV